MLITARHKTSNAGFLRTSFRFYINFLLGITRFSSGTICSYRNVPKSVLDPQKSKGIGPWIVPVEKKLSIGAYPEISLKHARQTAYEARHNIASGGDPAMGKVHDRTSGTIEQRRHDF